MNPTVKFVNEFAQLTTRNLTVKVPAIDISYKLDDTFTSTELLLLQKVIGHYNLVLTTVRNTLTVRFTPHVVWAVGFEGSLELNLATLVNKARQAVEASLAEVAKARNK